MNAEEIIKLNSILIGKVLPVGSTHVDVDCLENLDKLIEVMNKFVIILSDCAYEASQPEFSKQEIGNRAKEYIHELKVWASEMESEA